jgi:hypothetical protein
MTQAWLMARTAQASQLGFALSIAILGSVASAVYRSRTAATLPAGLLRQTKRKKPGDSGN